MLWPVAISLRKQKFTLSKDCERDQFEQDATIDGVLAGAYQLGLQVYRIVGPTDLSRCLHRRWDRARGPDLLEFDRNRPVLCLELTSTCMGVL